MPEVKKLGTIICDPYKFFQNFLASRSRETRIFTNAALFLPLAVGIRVNTRVSKGISVTNLCNAAVKVSQRVAF